MAYPLIIYNMYMTRRCPVHTCQWLILILDDETLWKKRMVNVWSSTQKNILRVIPTLTHYSDIVSDILSGIFSDILSEILSGIYSGILYIWWYSFWLSMAIWHTLWLSIAAQLHWELAIWLLLMPVTSWQRRRRRKELHLKNLETLTCQVGNLWLWNFPSPTNYSNTHPRLEMPTVSMESPSLQVNSTIFSQSLAGFWAPPTRDASSSTSPKWLRMSRA